MTLSRNPSGSESDEHPENTESAHDEAMQQHQEPDAAAYDQDPGDTTPPEARRSQLPLIIAGVVLLIVVGVGLGILFTRQSNQATSNQTTDAAATGTAPTDQPASDNQPAAAGADTADNGQVIARVGDTDITRGEFLRNYSSGQSPQDVMDQLINIELVVQAARDEGATVDQDEVDQQVEQLRGQHADPAAFDQFLQSANINSEEELRQLLARQQLIEDMLISHTQLEQARARHILLAADSEEALAERKPEAEELVAQIEEGADFAQLAEEHSEDPGSGAQGGELGWAPRGMFVPEFDEAIFSMEPGEVRLVQSQFGWHIIQLQDAPEVRAVEDVTVLQQTQAGQQALNESFLPWVDDLRTQAEEQEQIAILVEPDELVPPVPTPQPLPTTEP